MDKLTLKGIDFGAENLNRYSPETPHNFCVWLALTIGSESGEGTNLFQVGICTATWLSHQLSINNAYILRHLILVEKFDFELIKYSICKIIKIAERPSWEESVQVLCRYFSWEFEEHQL